VVLAMDIVKLRFPCLPSALTEGRPNYRAVGAFSGKESVACRQLLQNM
jgi:hypothetical protein